MLVALDTSASMRPVFADGLAAAATDVVVGVADAIGISDVSAMLIGDEAVPVRCAAAAQLAEAVGQSAPRWSAVARWARLPTIAARTVVCTDFPTRMALQRSVAFVFSNGQRLDARWVRMAPPPSGLRDVELLADSVALDRITSSLARALL